MPQVVRPVRIRPSVELRAASSEITGRYRQYLRVRIAAPPTDNALDAVLIRLIARALKVPRRDIRLQRGGRVG